MSFSKTANLGPIIDRAKQITNAHHLSEGEFNALSQDDLTLHTLVRAMIYHRSSQDYIRSGLVEDRDGLRPYANKNIAFGGVVGGFRWFTKPDGRKTFRLLLLDPSASAIIDGDEAKALENDPMTGTQHIWIDLFSSVIALDEATPEAYHVHLQEGMRVSAIGTVSEYAPGRFGLGSATFNQVGVARINPETGEELGFRNMVNYANFNTHGATWKSVTRGWDINLNRSDVGQMINFGLQNALTWYSEDAELSNALAVLMLLLSYDWTTQTLLLKSVSDPSDQEEQVLELIDNRRQVIALNGMTAFAPSVRTQELDVRGLPRVCGIPFVAPAHLTPEQREVEQWEPIDHSRGIDFRGDFWTRVSYQLKKKVFSRFEKRPGYDLDSHSRLGVNRAAQLVYEVIGDDATVFDLERVLYDRDFTKSLTDQLDPNRDFHCEVSLFFFDPERTHGYHDRHTDKFGNFYPRTTKFNRNRPAREAVTSLADEVRGRWPEKAQPQPELD